MNIDRQTPTRDASRSIHLSASAGSGKTRALKDRYLALLDVLDSRGLNVDQAVAITFTDKAAAEIKERVIRGLSEPMLKKIIRGRQDLRISTIHSFCMNLLKRYPLEAGLPPDFGVLDARDQAYKIEKAIEDTLEETDRDPELMGPLRGYTPNELIGIIDFLLSVRSRLKRLEIDAGGPDALIRAVRDGMDIDALETSTRALVESPEWRAVFMQMELLLRSQGIFYEECSGSGHAALDAAKDLQTVSRIAESLRPVYFTQAAGPRKKPAIAKSKSCASRTFPYTIYEKLFFEVQEVLSRFLSGYRRIQAGHETISLLRIFQRAEEKYQDLKLREGLLDFDDLEIYAYRLLQGRESPDILYWLDRKILHFLVDEFQDTSDIQWAILNKLTEEIFAGQGADKPMRPTLFVVGDEKQSIYRFREANYRLIENVRRRMEENLPPEQREIMTLDKNFRSTPEIVETANQVFGALWGEAYKPSETERKNHQGSVRLIELLPGAADEKSESPTEAEVLAREIKSLLGSGMIVYEKSKDDGWQTRPAGHGDCAILIQSRTRLKEYEAALQSAGVRFRVIGGIGFYEEDEIQALINILFFLWNRDDKLSLASALKSPLFGLTDWDIYDLMQGGGNIVDALKDQRPEAWKLIHDWMGLAGLVPLSGLIHRIVGETGAYVRFGRRNPQAIFNIDKLLDTAREFDRRGYTTLQDFVEWVKNIREAEQREATADMNLPGVQGAVSIMTVHKAKGLEFPVVFLPGMNQQPRSQTSGPLVIIEGDGGVRMAVKDAANPLYDELWGREREELRREHQRLLYVAMTRARDHLVMIGALSEGKTPIKQNTWLHYLHAASPKPLFDAPKELPSSLCVYSYPNTVEGANVPENPPQPPFEQEGLASSEQVPMPRIDVRQIIDNLSPIAPSKAPEWKRATDFIEHEKETALELLSLQTASGAVSPLTRGTVLHRCLEAYTKQGSYEIERIIADFPEIVSLGKDALQRFIDDARSILNRVLTNDQFTWIFDRIGNAYSELPFLHKRGNTFVSGVIDRVIIKDNKAYVVDYKAILIENEESLAAWINHYRPQIQVYCEAVREVFGLPAVEGYLLFLDSNRLERTTKV